MDKKLHDKIVDTLIERIEALESIVEGKDKTIEFLNKECSKLDDEVYNLKVELATKELVVKHLEAIGKNLRKKVDCKCKK